MAGGRPKGSDKYTQAIAETICAHLAEGKTLTSICGKRGVPSMATVCRWLVAPHHKDFKDQYDAARKLQLMVWADEIVDVSDTPMIGTKTVQKSSGTETTTADNVQRSIVRIESRKWILARQWSEMYGDRVKNEHTGPNGGPIQIDRIERVIVDAPNRNAARLPPAA